MSREDVERIRNHYATIRDALASDSLAAVNAEFDPDIEYNVPEVLPWGGTFHGHAEVLAYFARWGEYVEGGGMTPEKILDAGDHVVALGHVTGRVRATGIEFTVPVAHVWELRDGKAIRFDGYADTATVIRALTG